MGEFIGVLVWIGIIVFGVIKKNAVNDSKKKKIEDVEKNIKDIFSGKIDWNTLQTKLTQSDSEKEKELSEENWVPAYEKAPVKEPVHIREAKESFQNTTVARGAYNPDTANVKRIAAKSKKEKKLGSESKGNKPLLTEDDIIKGIIFKEILDKPRAINPYKNIARR